MERLDITQIGEWFKENGLGVYETKFAEEQIDGMGLLGLNENDLESLIPQRGPRAKLRFLLTKQKDSEVSSQTYPGISGSCQDDAISLDKSVSSVKEKLNLIRKRRLERCSMQTGESLGLKRPRKDTYKITFGWLKKVGSKYRYVMPRKGGGAKKADVPRAANYMEMCNIARSLFSIAERDHCYLGNFNGEPVSTSIMCEDFVKSSNFVTLPRLYIVTVVPQTLSSDDDIDARRSLSPPCLTPQKLVDVLTALKLDNSKTEIMAPEVDNNENVIVVVEEEAEKNAELGDCCVIKRQVSMEEVHEYIEKIVSEEEYNPGENESFRLAGENDTPVQMRNTSVMYFIDLMKQNGKQYKVVDSGWGPFVILPNEDLCSFFSLRDGFDMDSSALICPPVLYFLALNNIPFQHISENVIKVDDDVLQKYHAWLEEMKISLKMLNK